MNGAETDNRRTVIITGASRGIGHATAKTFLDRGWRILTCSRDEAPPECKRDPNWTCHIPTDLGDAASLAALHRTRRTGRWPAGRCTRSSTTPECRRRRRLKSGSAA